ncbi:MAG: hypothetical protein FWE91_04265 [Defluviitaleaceae bacterium]|nr:hypothetical protein [Defluviitaleaceae bacterium]MCL2836965.1 hypothetical protein [Defluviitaleaceae bacterium]
MNYIAEREDIMTDFQFKAIVTMILNYVKTADDIDKVKEYLEQIIADEKHGSKK